MNVSIGIFAHNEESRIAATLASLREQDAFESAFLRDATIEVVVLPNGCFDRTAEAAAEALRDRFGGLGRVQARVERLAEPGKSRTWNVYVHRLADPKADVLILMDGDIRLVGASTLRGLVKTLLEHPEAHAAVDAILKDIALKQNPTAREKLSLAASALARGGPPKLAGSLYAARGAVLRGIWMPEGLLVEDGYLRAMLCTDNFTRAENRARLALAEQAAHTFEAVTDLRTLFKHEVRLLVGSAMNFALFEHLHAQVQATGLDAGRLVAGWNEADPGWFANLVDRSLSKKGRWLAPTEFVLLPLRQLRTLSPMGAIEHLPAALIRSAFTLAAAVAANGRLRRRVFTW